MKIKFNDIENKIRKSKGDDRYNAIKDSCIDLAHYFAQANVHAPSVCKSMITRSVDFWHHICAKYPVYETEDAFIGFDEAYFGTCIVAICGKNAISLLPGIGLSYNPEMLDDCVKLMYPPEKSSKMFLIGVH